MDDSYDDLRHDLARQTDPQAGPPPLADMKHRGQWLRRRRQLMTAATAAATATIVGAVVLNVWAPDTPGLPASGSGTATPSAEPPTTEQPDPPDTTETPDSRPQPPCQTETSDEPGSGEVLVYFSCGWSHDPPIGQRRRIESGLGMEQQLREAFVSYLQGPTPAERQRGYRSVFGTNAQRVLNDVHIETAGRVVIDIDLAAAGYASTTSTQAGFIWQQLRAIAFQFTTINELEPRSNGSCDQFGASLQAGECLIAQRGGEYTTGA